jgi:hypothetical protein
MIRVHPALKFFAAALCGLVVGGCATPRTAPPPSLASAAVGQNVLRGLAYDRATEDRVLAMNPESVSPDDVKVLAAGPTPRIVLLHGGIYPVHMAMTSFGGFLTDMGYPEAKIRNPADGSWSHSPYENAVQQAGLLAWYYEHEGLRPMMIGHSQGGIQAVKILRELDGQYGDKVVVWGPYDNADNNRTSYVDPLTGAERPVIGGMVVPYVSVVAAGGAALILPNQWSMVGNLRAIPNTVEDFTGYSLGLDIWAWSVRIRRSTTTTARPRFATCSFPPGTTTCCCRSPRTWRPSRRRAPGSTPTRLRRTPTAPRKKRPGRARCGPPTSGTASRSTGYRKRSGRFAPGGLWSAGPDQPGKMAVLSGAGKRADSLPGPDRMAGALTGKVALVTGAARGIGRAIAVKLATEGCDIAANYYNSSDEAEALCAEVRALGRRAVAIKASVGVPDSVDELFEGCARSSTTSTSSSATPRAAC